VSGAAAPRTWRAPSGWPPRSEWSQAERAATAARVAGLRDRLRDGLLESVQGRTARCRRRPPTPGSTCSPATSTCACRASEREELLVALGAEDVSVSGGSSCASGALQPSHVLSPWGRARAGGGALRFTLGYGTTDADIDRALAVVPAVVAALRRGG